MFIIISVMLHVMLRLSSLIRQLYLTKTAISEELLHTLGSQFKFTAVISEKLSIHLKD